MNIIRHECESSGELLLAGKHRIDFDYAHDVVMDVWHRLAAHPNGMRFQAFDQQNNLVDEQVWYSIGGGFVRQGNAEDLMIGIHERPPVGTSFADQQSDSSLDDGSDVPYPFTSCDELIALCEKHHMSIADIVWANETAMQSAVQVRSELDNVWRVMRRCVQHGCHTSQTVLPGGLNAPRRAPKMYARLASNSDVLARDKKRADAVLESSDAAWGWICSLWRCRRKTPGGGRNRHRTDQTVLQESFRQCFTITGISLTMRTKRVLLPSCSLQRGRYLFKRNAPFPVRKSDAREKSVRHVRWLRPVCAR